MMRSPFIPLFGAYGQKFFVIFFPVILFAMKSFAPDILHLKILHFLCCLLTSSMCRQDIQTGE